MRKSYFILACAALALGTAVTSCAPSIVNPITNLGEDAADMKFARAEIDGKLFTSVVYTNKGIVERLNIYVGGENVDVSKNLKDSGVCKPMYNAKNDKLLEGYGCSFGTVNYEPPNKPNTTIFVSGKNVTVNASWQRPGSNVPHFIYAALQ